MASLRGVRRRVCGRKRRYETLEEARAAAMAIQRLQGGHRMNAYECSWCAGHHVGHEPAEMRRKRLAHERDNAQRAEFVQRQN